MRALILSPHTDDAELGCGGLITWLIEKQSPLLWIVFSTAEESLPEGLPRDTLKKEFLNVISGLGLNETNYQIFNYQVRRLHHYRQEVLENLVKIRDTFKPQLVVGPSLNDFHQDHQTIANEMIRAFKTTASIICYELPWNHTGFHTQLFVPLTREHVLKKYQMLSKYHSQIIQNKSYFSEEFIFGLAKTRGVQCNAEYAEAFEVIRWLL
ncbi:PIG-L deacetylase family protein [Syntrophaceticus schinkii]|jgi:LmbE family N-acetylglucosaminyl deacetylase|uniref:LmbE family protein n=1 Tax=Syntrophaceticus schinkii TaxID=499207 RepID=A0A0B7MHM8_9FIRM|nr:PIG-L family deacetylase [Syntrophaceticus schinkii]CEO89570.1 LmbE family protein [Syntrophaceticus schinkii]